MKYESVISIESLTHQGVVFVVSRMSFGRRLELMRLVRGIAVKVEFHRAGESEGDKMESAILSAEIDRLYLTWGLVEIRGLSIDGEAATPNVLASSGPEELFREALLAVRTQCGLTEQERKN